MATITITVTVSNPGSGNKYYLDGVLQATYVATPGNTYKFDQADGSNSGHPLRLSITSDGTHNSGSAYTTGVTTNGTPGSAGAYTQIEVTATTVQALYYYCTAHSGMGGSFNTGSSATVQFQDRKGFDIQNLSSDSTSVGQMYYNSTSGQFKVVKDGGAPIGTWASGTNVNTARRSLASAGTQTASIIAGGLLPPGTYDETEVWNGTAWTEVADLNTGRYYFKGSGTSTATIVYAGMVSNPTATAATEQWNGSGWTEIADLNTARQKIGNSTTGTTTASLAFGGSPADPAGGGALAINESWNGSAWTEVGDMNTARKDCGGAGTSTAALAIGGQAPSDSALNESWNGSAWTEVGDLNTAVFSQGSAGTQTSAIKFGGNPTSPGALTESWDGSSWTEVADLAQKSAGQGSAGVSASSAASLAGYNGTANIANVEEWTAAAFEVKTLTTS